jgi:hypothetical protein
MPILQLPKGTADKLVAIPEAAMGLQAVQIGDMAALIVGGQIAILPDDRVAEQLRALSERVWMRDGEQREAQISDFDSWRGTLPMAQNVTFYPQQPLKAILGFILHGPVGPLPLAPLPPPYVYGHLLFHGSTQAKDVFYRYESFPTSQRINQTTKTIAANSFAAPESEMPLTPSGFSAVARFALPSLFPARWRWELKPVAGTVLKCGASVPLYGQSGGGVEAMFVASTMMRAPVPNPFVLDAL